MQLISNNNNLFLEIRTPQFHKTFLPLTYEKQIYPAVIPVLAALCHFRTELFIYANDQLPGGGIRS